MNFTKSNLLLQIKKEAPGYSGASFLMISYWGMLKLGGWVDLLGSKDWPPGFDRSK